MAKIKIKKSWIKWILVIVILILIALLYIPTFEKEAPDEPFEAKDVVIPDKEDEPVVEAESGAQYGDLVKINYVLRMEEDGTVIDTNNATLAEKHGVKNYVKGAFSFILGQSDKIYGMGTNVKPFDDAIKGLKINDSETINIKPSEKLMAYEFNISQTKPRRTNIPAVHKYTRNKYLELFNNETAEIGKIVSNYDEFPWPYEIVNMSKKNVYLKVVVDEGDEFIMPGTDWKSVAVDVGEKVIIWEQNPELGQIVRTNYGVAKITNVTFGLIWFEHMPELGKEFSQMIEKGSGSGLMYDFKVWEVTEDQFMIRRINYPQQEKLILDVEVLDIIEDVKKLD